MGEKEHYEITPKLLGGHAENQSTARIQRLHPLISTLGKNFKFSMGHTYVFSLRVLFLKEGK